MNVAVKLANRDPILNIDGKSELRELIRQRSFRTGRFTLSSGKESNLYFNMKPTMMWARGAELAAREFLEIARRLGVTYVGGLEMGAVPLIGAMAALSSTAKRPIKTFFVRKEPKKHGTRDVIEGLGPAEFLEKESVLIVDDVATSGQSFMKAVNAAREAGAIVQHAACILNRQEGADDLLRANAIELHSVFQANEFVAAL